MNPLSPISKSTKLKQEKMLSGIELDVGAPPTSVKAKEIICNVVAWSTNVLGASIVDTCCIV